MGILDGLLGSSIEDPRTQATMAMVQGLLSSPKALGGISQGLLGYGGAMAEAKKAAAAEEMRKMQLAQHALQFQEAQRAAQQAERDRALTQQAFTPVKPIEANQASGITGPRPSALGVIGQQPAFDPRQFIASGGSAPLAFQLQQSLAKEQPKIEKIGQGETAGYVKDGKWVQVAANAPKDDAPSALKEYQFAVSQGEKRSFTDWQAAMKRAGAPSVNVNTAKPLLNTVAEGLGKQLDAGLESARAAQGAIQTAQSLKSAIDSGKVISGPGATFRIAGLQIGQTLGIGGKDAAETLANTRQAMQSMAQSELDAASQMRGQGALTEAERAILRRAASGDIDSLTGPEIRLMADVSERNARRKIAAHKSNVTRLKAMPDAGPIMPFYDVEEPAPYTPSGASAKVRRYNPATGKIE